MKTADFLAQVKDQVDGVFTSDAAGVKRGWVSLAHSSYKWLRVGKAFKPQVKSHVYPAGRDAETIVYARPDGDGVAVREYNSEFAGPIETK